MNKRTLITAATLTMAIAGAASAEIVIPIDVDLGGGPGSIQFASGFGFAPDALESISWDLTAVTMLGSGGSEITMNLFNFSTGYGIDLDGSDANLFDLGPAAIEFGWDDIGGTYTSSGIATVAGGDILPSPSIAGSWMLTIFDEFNSIPQLNDAHLTGTITINAVPAPGALVLLGLGGVAAGRRRRRA